MTSAPFPPEGLLAAYSAVLPVIAAESPRCTPAVKEFACVHATSLFPPKEAYDHVPDAGKYLIACEQTLHFLLTKSPESSAWLKSHVNPHNSTPWLNQGGIYAETEDLLVFNKHGSHTASNWLTHPERDCSSFGPYWITQETNQKQVIQHTLRALGTHSPRELETLLHDITDETTRIALKALAKDLVPGLTIPAERSTFTWLLGDKPQGLHSDKMDIVLEFLKRAQVEDHVTEYVTSLYHDDRSNIAKPLAALVRTSNRNLIALINLPKFPKAPGMEKEETDVSPAIQSAYQTYITQLSRVSLGEGLPSCDFIVDYLSEQMGIRPEALPAYLARNVHCTAPGGQLVSAKFFDAVESFVTLLNHTFKTGEHAAVHALREGFVARRAVAAPSPAVVGPSPYIAATKTAMELYKTGDCTAFMAHLDTIEGMASIEEDLLCAPKEPVSFKTQVLHRLWATSPAARGSDDPNWSMNHWHDDGKLMGQVLLATMKAFNQTIDSHTA